MGRIEFRESLNYACAEGEEFLNGKSGILENHGKTENVEIELLYCHSLKKKSHLWYSGTAEMAKSF